MTLNNVVPAVLLVVMGLFLLGMGAFFVNIFLWNKEARGRLRREPKEAFACFLMFVGVLALCLWGTRTMVVSPDRANPLAFLGGDSQPKGEGEEGKPVFETEEQKKWREWQQSPKNPEPWEKKAEEHEKAGRLAEAITALDEAIRLNHEKWDEDEKTHGKGWSVWGFCTRDLVVKRAELHSKVGRHDKAVTDWEEVIAIHKRRDMESLIPYAKYNRAVSLQKAKRWKEAIKEFDRMIVAKEPNPLDHEPYLRLSEIYTECPDPAIRDEKLAAKYQQLAKDKQVEAEEWREKLRREDWGFPDGEFRP